MSSSLVYPLDQLTVTSVGNTGETGDIFGTQCKQQYRLHLRKFVSYKYDLSGFKLQSLEQQAGMLPIKQPLLVFLIIFFTKSIN